MNNTRSRTFLHPFFLPIWLLAITTVFQGYSCFAADSDLDSYGGFLAVKGRKTGFFHIEEIDGRQWLVTPEGHGIFARSISHPLTSESSITCETLYKGDQRAWISDILKSMRELGFNCMLSPPATPDRIKHGGVDSAVAHDVMLEGRFPHTIGLILAKHPVEMKEGEKWPDIFSAEYRDFVWAEAKKLSEKYGNEPLVVGYFYGYGTFNNAVGWINDLLQGDPSSAGRIHLSAILKYRYEGRLEDFNKIYKTSFKNLAEVSTGKLPEYPKLMKNHATKKFANERDQAMADDFGVLMAEMSRQIHRLAYEAIRTYDRNHLLLGGSVKENDFSDAMWAAAAPYLDAICPQHIRPNVDINRQAKLAQKPIIVSDLVNGHVVPQFPIPKQYRKSFNVTWEERVEIYRRHLQRVAQDADMIGVNFCATMYDQKSEMWRHRGEQGFYDLKGEPRPFYINSITELNADVYSLATSPLKGMEKEKADAAFLDFYQSMRIPDRESLLKNE